MEALTGVVNAAGPFLKLAQPLIQGFGVVSNLIQGHRQSGLQSTAINNVNQLSQLANNPQAMAARIRALQQPLNQGLVSGVGNEVQGYLAERGLALSPAIQSQVMAQALGPYQVKEQELAQQAAFAPYQELGYLTNAAQHSGPGIANTQGLWDALSKLPVGSGAGVPQISPSANLPGQAYPTYMPNPPTPYNPNLPSYENPIPYDRVDPFAGSIDATPPTIQFPGADQLPNLGGD